MSIRRDVARALIVAAAFVAVACTESPSPSEPGASPSPSYNRSGVAQDRLAALFPATSSDVLGLPGTVWADHDEQAGKLVFGVENANAITGVKRSLAARGISVDEYVIKIVPPVVQLATLRDNFSSKVGGIQIHFGGYLCTLGFNATHVSSGDRSFITNSHCTNTQGGVEGTQYYQPSSSVDGTVIATEVDDPIYSSCSQGKICRYSDASRARYSSGTSSTQGEIAKTIGVNGQSLTQDGVFTVTAQDNATKNFTSGTSINKVGRTTGWTQGAVTNSCVNVNVSGSRIQQLCQTLVTNTSATIVGSGDSGSAAFTLSGGNATLVGILWGGSGANTFVFSPLKNIQDELGGLVATADGSGGGTGGGGGGGGGCVPKGNGKNCK